MNYLYFIILLLAQLSIGYNILALFKVQLHRFSHLALSVLLGIATMSLIPFALEMMFIPLTGTTIFSVIAAVALILFIPNIKHYRTLKINTSLPNIKMYELPWLGLLGMLCYIIFFFALWIPATPRDLLSGPEPIAQFALTEHKFINSVFDQEMPMNNGPFKSLYLPSLQLIYKLIGFPFGKMWLPILVVSFLAFLYVEVRRIVNPVIAGLLVSFLVFATELFAYTYLVLFDYSNMVFYFISLYMVYQYLTKNELKYLWLSALLMGIATFIRPETLILSAFVCAYIVIHKFVKKQRTIRELAPVVSIGIVSAIFYFVSSYMYLHYYLPVFYNVEGIVNDDLLNLAPLFDRLGNTIGQLIYSEMGIKYYGYIFYVWLMMVIAELIVYRKISMRNGYWLIMMFITYFAISFMGFLLPLADLNNTTKRSLFKVLPLVVMYLANNKLVLALSEKMNNFLAGESGSSTPKAKPATATAAPKQKNKKGKK